jgi:hypothetical protein
MSLGAQDQPGEQQDHYLKKKKKNNNKKKHIYFNQPKAKREYQSQTHPTENTISPPCPEFCIHGFNQPQIEHFLKIKMITKK